MLLYKGIAKEYMQAKIMATKKLGIQRYPSNYEIAIELDRIADEFEGKERKEFIIKMRKMALKLMRLLKEYNPRLSGSVWRGTARIGSDIDILVYASDPSKIVQIIKKNNFKIIEKKWIKTDFNKFIKSFFNIRTAINIEQMEQEFEITVRGVDDTEIIEKCEIYGDLRKGLSIEQLINILNKDALKKFVPKKRPQPYSKK